MRVVIFLILPIAVIGCDRDADMQKVDSSPPDWPNNKWSRKAQEDPALLAQYESQNKFIHAWKSGSVREWDKNDAEENADAIFDFIDINIKIYGVNFWSALPEARENQELTPAFGSQEHQLLVKLRDWAYKAKDLEEGLEVIKNVDNFLSQGRELEEEYKIELQRDYMKRTSRCTWPN